MATTTSLDNILFRRLEGWTERPSVVDREEFTEHIEELLAAGVDHLAAEEFVEHFYEGNPQLGEGRRPDVAAAVVAATKKRLQVYDFNLDRYEYVVLEEEDKVVVVSE